MSSSNDFRARLTRYFEHYAPDKVGTVDAIAAKCAGKEEEVMRQLVAKFGPEMPTSAAAGGGGASRTASSAPAAANNAFRERLTRFYAKYQPEKLSQVDAFLHSFAGKEELMFQKLVEKYGPEPPASMNTAPPPAAVVATPSVGANPHRERLVRYLEEKAPDKVGTADALLQKFAGREDELFRSLESKLGPATAAAAPTSAARGVSQPPPRPPAASVPPAAAASPAKRDQYKARLIRFYEKYAPEKVATVDVALNSFAGEEDLMFRKLVEKYGPEPPESPAAAAAPTAVPSGGAPPVRATTAPPAPSDAQQPFRDRLTRYFQHYAPDKLSSVDQLLERYKGKEEDLMKALVSKLGPEPTEAATTAPNRSPAPSMPPARSRAASTHGVPTAAVDDHRARLVRFYTKYAPDKLAQVDAALNSFAGREDAMFEKLVAKYGPEPHAEPAHAADNSAQSWRDRLTKYFQHYAPDKVGSVDALLQKYQGKEEQLLLQLVAKLGPEPQQTAATDGSPTPARSATNVVHDEHRARLVRFYTKYAPDKLSQVDAALNSFAGREDAMFAKLVQKYGPEPPPDGSASTTKSLAAADRGNVPRPAADVADYRRRVARFLQKYNPQKIDNVDALMAKYAGREHELIDVLTSKYGAEPAETDDPQVVTRTPSEPAAPQPAPSVAPPSAAAPATCTPAAAAPTGAPAPSPPPKGPVAPLVIAAVPPTFDYSTGLRACIGVDRASSVVKSLQSVAASLSDARAAAWGLFAEMYLKASSPSSAAETTTRPWGLSSAPMLLEVRDTGALSSVGAALPHDDEVAAKAALHEFCQLYSEEQSALAVVEGTERIDWAQLALVAMASRRDADEASRVRNVHRLQVLQRALQIIHQVEAQHRDDIGRAEALEREGRVKWFRQQCQEILLRSPSAQIAALEQRMREWKQLIKRNTEWRDVNHHHATDEERRQEAAILHRLLDVAGATPSPRVVTSAAEAATPPSRGAPLSRTTTPRRTASPTSSLKAPPPPRSVERLPLAAIVRDEQSDSSRRATTPRSASRPTTPGRVWNQHVPVATCSPIKASVNRSSVRLPQAHKRPGTLVEPFHFSTEMRYAAGLGSDMANTTPYSSRPTTPRRA